jgi:hypothetical protein
MSNDASLLRETEEAIRAGQEAHSQAQNVLDTLRSAKGWGVYDLLGGGMLSGLIKHSRMDKAQQQMEDFRRALERFNRELKDVRVQCSASAELSAFWRIADLAWDGLISDWTVLSKISTAKARVEQTDAQLMQALDQLQQTRRRVLERMNRA